MSEVTEDQVPFEVNGEVEVGDLNTVNDVMPQAQNVHVSIDKASVQVSKDKDLKSLKLELRILDGIANPESGELQYVGKKLFPGFMDMCIWANPETKTSQWYKDKKHLLAFKQFCKALDIELSNVVVNDDFCASILGRDLLVNIVHQEETVKDEQGNRIKTGEISDRITGFKKAV